MGLKMISSSRKLDGLLVTVVSCACVAMGRATRGSRVAKPAGRAASLLRNTLPFSGATQCVRRKERAPAVYSKVIFSQPMACLLELANIGDNRQDKEKLYCCDKTHVARAMKICYHLNNTEYLAALLLLSGISARLRGARTLQWTPSSHGMRALRRASGTCAEHTSCRPAVCLVH